MKQDLLEFVLCLLERSLVFLNKAGIMNIYSAQCTRKFSMVPTFYYHLKITQTIDLFEPIWKNVPNFSTQE